MITLRNKIAQMLIMGFDGCEINEHSPITHWLSNEGLGGVLLFDKDLHTGLYGKNIKNTEQIKQLTKQLNSQKAYAEELPLFIALDYEGGYVDRLSKVEECLTTLTPAKLAKLSDKDLKEELNQMAFTLKSLGFNLNFAPIVDLNLNEQEGIIGKLERSFSADPKQVVRVASLFVEVFNQHGIVCSYKHFPGHGSAIGDTHEGFVDVTDTFKSEELTPYRHLFKNDQQSFMVMTAHVINKQLDNKGDPATLSSEILTGLLRRELGYEGVVISDDLQMRAISEHYTLEESLRLTINAGADMLIFANQLGQITAPEVIDCIEHLVFHRKIEAERIDEAYNRIVRLKKQMIYL